MTDCFVPADKDAFASMISVRSGETKMGELMSYGQVSPQNKYAIIGISESIGPQANYGSSGAENGFDSFIKRFLNMQSNRFLSGELIHLCGVIRFDDSFSTVDQARSEVAKLDSHVEQIVRSVLEQQLIPIVIGGGHNNAYPIIKAVSSYFRQAIEVVNLDPHADCRKLEGRHSGNSFSHALTEGLIKNYSVLGLHKAYNNEHTYDFLEENNCFHSFYDDYIMTPEHFTRDISTVQKRILPSDKIGIELDLDAIQGMPASAFTPSGFSLEQARFYVKSFGAVKQCCYLHLPEGAPLNESENKLVGKALAYLVWDFIFSTNYCTN